MGYVFYVDVRFETAKDADAALVALREHRRMVKVGRYRAAGLSRSDGGWAALGVDE
jgi:hypothetical protein